MAPEAGAVQETLILVGSTRTAVRSLGGLDSVMSKSTNNGMIMKNPKDNILVRYFAEDWSYKPNLPVIVGIGPARPGLNIIY